MTDQELLNQAKSEYHNLQIGLKAQVFVDQNGERIEYTRASSWRLEKYIKDLEARIGGKSSVSGPARVQF